MPLFYESAASQAEKGFFKNHTVSRRGGNGGQDPATSATEPRPRLSSGDPEVSRHACGGNTEAF